MKKIFKRSKHVILLLLITLLSFGFIAVSSNNNSLSVNAETNNPQFEKSYFSLDYSNNELTLLFSPNLSDYKDIQRSDLVEFKNMIVSKLSDIFASETKDVRNSRKNNIKKANNGSSDVDVSVVEGIINNQLSNMEEIEVNFLERGSYDTLIKFYVDRYADTYLENNPEADVNEVLDTISTDIISAVNEKVNEVYVNEGYGDDAPTDETTTKINELVNEVKDLKANNQSVNIDLNDVKDVMNIVASSDDIVEVIKTIDVNSEINQIINEASGEEIVDFFTEVDIDKIIDVTKNTTIISKDDFNNVANKVGVSDLVKIADTIGQDKLKEFAKVIDVNASDLSQIIKDNVSNIGVKDILAMVTAIRVNNEAIYANKEFSLTAIKNIIAQLPKPSEIAKFTDEQMRLSWVIEVETVFVTKGFKFTIGLDGDCSKIRKLAELVDRYIEVNVVDGTYHFNTFTPSKLSDLLLSATQTSRISDSLKNKIFNAMSLNVNDVYELVQDITLTDIINVLKSVNYKKIVAKLIDADTLNSYLHTTVFTNERIDRVIDSVLDKARVAQSVTYEDIQNAIKKVTGRTFDNETLKLYANKVLGLLDLVNLENVNSQKIREFADPNSQYSNETLTNHFDGLLRFEDEFNRVKSLISKVYSHVPEKYKSVSLFDFYQGNGEFDVNNTFNVKELLSKIEYNDYNLSDILAIIVDYIPESVSVDFNIKTTDIYQISYVYGGEVKKGFLPVGADIKLFANDLVLNGHLINKWVDSQGNEVTTMPASDTVLYPFTQFSVVASDDVNKEYDGKAVELAVTVIGDDNGIYTYQWYKDGELIEGAIDATYSVVNVDDSGEYYCIVTSGGSYNESRKIKVVITPVEVVLPTFEWSVNKEQDYNGNQFTAHITNLPEYVTVTYTNDVAINAGTYTTIAHLEAINSNYKLLKNQAYFTWTINKVLISIPKLTWKFEEVEYNGEEFRNEFSTILPEGVSVVYSDNVATNANKYISKATLSVENGNYYLTQYEFTHNWTIAPKAETIEFIWLITGSVEYNGSEFINKVTNELPLNVKVLYTDEKGTDAGTHTTTARILNSNTNYQYTLSNNSVTWTITPKAIDVSSVTWKVAASNVYTGNEFVDELVNLPSGVEVTYENNKGTNVGTYTSKATLTVGANYELSSTTLTHEWKITPKAIDVSSVTWKVAASNVYTGKEFVDELVNLPSGVEVTYENNKGTNVGTYTSKATLTVGANYELSSTTLTHEWKITKKELFLNTVQWNYINPFVYDGKEHEVLIVGLPSEITVTYTENKATNAGVYVAKAVLSVDDNHHLENNTYTLTWEIKQQATPIIDKETNFETMGGAIKVYVKDGINKDFVLNSVDKTNDYKNFDVSAILVDNERGKIRAAYDIYFMKGAFEEKVNGEFTIELLIPEKLRNKTIKVIHISDDDEITNLEFTRNGDYVVINTTHFSIYAIVEVTSGATIPWIIWVVVALLVLFIIGLVVELYIKRKEQDPMVISNEEKQVAEEKVAEEQIEQVDLTDEEDEQVSFEEEKPVDIPEPENDTDRFEDSYFGNLINSEDETKGYYAILKKEILSYSLNEQKVESKISWKNEKFMFNDEVVAKFKMRNNKLYVSLPLSSEEYLNASESETKDNFVCCIKNSRRCKYTKGLVALVMKKYGLTK